jgi:hypothetical protein
MSNSESDLSSEDKLLTVFDYITIDSDDEDLPRERQWHCGTFTPTISQFVGQQNPVGERQDMSNWQNVTSIEMYTFFAITMLTGLIDKNRIQDY